MVCKVVVFIVFVVFVLFRGQTRGKEGQEKHKGHEIHGGCENVISFFKMDSQIFPLIRDKLSHLVVSTRKILPTPALTFSSSLADVVFFRFATIARDPMTAACHGYLGPPHFECSDGSPNLATLAFLFLSLSLYILLSKLNQRIKQVLIEPERCRF